MAFIHEAYTYIRLHKSLALVVSVTNNVFKVTVFDRTREEWSFLVSCEGSQEIEAFRKCKNNLRLKTKNKEAQCTYSIM